MSSIRANLVTRLAPVAPPCFQARDIWVEYLKAAAESGRVDHPSPLVQRRGEEARFNYDYNFCADCDAQHAARMARDDLCKPLHLRILALKGIPIVLVGSALAPASEVACEG